MLLNEGLTWGEELSEGIASQFGNGIAGIAMKIVAALVILIVGLLLVKLVLKIVKKGKAFGKLAPEVQTFTLSAIKVLGYVLVVLLAVATVGVPTASIIAVLGSCGLAVGLALQGSLANLAGGIMLLLFRPFNVGDYISATDAEGTVREINLFYTVINTLDNKVISIPNGTLMAANITNITKEDFRRVDLTFNISGADIAGARQVMLEQMKANDKVLDTPAPPFAEPLEGIPGGICFTTRAWTKTEDYWDVYHALMDVIPTALGKAGIGGPLPATQIVTDK